MNNKGQTLFENMLIIGMMSSVVFSLTALVGGMLKDNITKSSCDFVDKIYVEGVKLGQGTCVNE